MSVRLSENEKELWLAITGMAICILVFGWISSTMVENTGSAIAAQARVIDELAATVRALASAEIVLEARVEFLEARIAAEAQARADHDREIWSAIASEEE